jgi:hypothetical protein
MEKISTIFKETESGLIAVNAETDEILRDESGEMMSPLEYFRSIEYMPKSWTVAEKSKFIQDYGSKEYMALVANGREVSDYGLWSDRRKSEYIAEYGQQAFMNLVRKHKKQTRLSRKSL